MSAASATAWRVLGFLAGGVLISLTTGLAWFVAVAISAAIGCAAWEIWARRDERRKGER